MELSRPYRAYKQQILNMVALPHYPIICRPFWTCEYFAVLTVEVEFFLELNAKHIHAPQKRI